MQSELFPSVTKGRIFSRLHTAAHTSQRIAIEYMDVVGNVTRRTIRPSEIYRHDGNWYVDAICELRQAQRYFRVSRVGAAKLLGAWVEPKASASQACPLEPTVLTRDEAEHLEEIGLTPACTYACRNGCDCVVRWVA